MKKIDLLPLSPLQTKALRLGPAALAKYDRLTNKHAFNMPFAVVYVTTLAVSAGLLALTGLAERVLYGGYQWVTIVSMVASGSLGALFSYGYTRSRIQRHTFWMAQQGMFNVTWLREFLPMARQLQAHAADLAAANATEPDDFMIETIHRFLLGDEPGYTPPPLLTTEQRAAVLNERAAEAHMRMAYGPELTAWAANVGKVVQ